MKVVLEVVVVIVVVVVVTTVWRAVKIVKR